MPSKPIKQSVTFSAPPATVYKTLMDQKLHAKFTEAPASIENFEGGKFSCYDDYIEGVNVELVPGKKIVQQWRGSDWPKNHFSTATFSLSAENGGTKLTFTQVNVPENEVENIAQGWKDHYWDKMKEFFKK